MGKETIHGVASKGFIFTGAVSVLASILSCSSQNSGFTSSVSSACAGNSCSTALVNNNASVFITSQAAHIPKGVSYLPKLQFVLAPASIVNRTKVPAATYTVFGQKAEIAGTCNTGGAAAHKITFSIRDVNSVIIPADIYNAGTSGTYSDPLSKYLKPAYCDNGRFTLIITPPNDPAVVTAAPAAGHNACAAPITNYCNEKPLYYLAVSIWTGPDANNLTVASSFETTFTVQY